MYVHPLMNYFWQNCYYWIYSCGNNLYSQDESFYNTNYKTKYQCHEKLLKRWLGKKTGVRGQRGSNPRLKISLVLDLKKIIKRTEWSLIISKSEKENGEKASH